MATITHCDGTGVEIPPDTPTTGYLGHQYCDEAREIAETYLMSLNSLHTRHAEDMQKELNELRAYYREQLRTLPDDPT